jgi:hypothetical protein
VPAESIADDLLRKRSDYANASAYERFLCDAYTGGGGFRGRMQRPDYSPEALVYSAIAGESSYLDKFERETDDEFTARKSYSAYTNYCRPTTDLKVSYLLRKGWQYVNEPPAITEWRRRTRFDEGNQRRAALAAVFGWLPVQVDMPATPDGALTALQAGKPDPYLSLLLPINLYDWDADESGRLLWAKTAMVSTRRDSWASTTTAKVERVTVWERGAFSVYEVVTGDSGNAAVRLIQQGAHPFAGVPVVSWRASMNADDPMRGDSVMAGVAELNRAVYNIESEERSVMRASAFPVFVLPTKLPVRISGETDAEYLARIGVEVGPSNTIFTDPDQKNAPMWLSPGADVFKTYAELKKAAVIELYRLARVEYDRASGTASSAQSKQQNFEQTNLAVVDMAKSLAHGVLETLRLVGRALGVGEAQLAEFSVQAYDSYASEDLNADLEAATMALADSAMGETFHAELRKRLADRMLPGMGPKDRAKMHGEIESGAKEALDAKAQEQAALIESVGAAVNADANADSAPDAQQDEPPQGDQ